MTVGKRPRMFNRGYLISVICAVDNAPMRTFDLNLLPVLVAIHEHGSVTGAAQRLGMSQSAVSTALARLRRHYGDPLFHRVGHGMEATARTRALIEPLRDALTRVN